MVFHHRGLAPRPGKNTSVFSPLSRDKNAFRQAGVEVLQYIAFFTRILAVSLPDTFVATAADTTIKLIGGLQQEKNETNKIKINLDNYWDTLLPLLHAKPLFSKEVGDTSKTSLALLDCILWEKDSNDENNTQTTHQTKNHERKVKSISAAPLNQILYGPPGTGKTFKTREAALKVAAPDFPENKKPGELKEKYNKLYKDGQIVFVTFHQSYGYEEFIEGISAKSGNRGISYEIKNGIFKNICERAKDNKDNNYVLIIDEINRGNISKIFGELITLVEESKRKGKEEELSVTLPCSGEYFSIPENLYIIGTMNTADRSLAMMDTALRRRFDFKEMMPEPELFGYWEIKEINLKNLLTKLNERLEVLYDHEHTLEHAFFFPAFNAMEKRDEALTFKNLQSAFQNKIIPLLLEYFYDDWNKIRLVLGDNQKSDDIQFIKKIKTDHAALFGKNESSDEFLL